MWRLVPAITSNSNNHITNASLSGLDPLEGHLPFKWIEALTRIGSFYKTSDALPAAMFAAGTALLLIGTVWVLRTAPANQPAINPSSRSTTP